MIEIQPEQMQQIQVQPKQQAPAQVPKKKGRKDQQPSQDDFEEQEIIHEKLAVLKKKKEEMNIPDSASDLQQLIEEIDNNNNVTPKYAQEQFMEMIQVSIFSQTAKQQQETAGSKTYQRIASPLSRMINTKMNRDKPVYQTQQPDALIQIPTHRLEDKQRLKKSERESEQINAKQQLYQQENNDLKNTNIEIPDIQGTVEQLTGLQQISCFQSPGLNAGLRLKEAGSISAGNRERTELKINDGHEDNIEEEEDEQSDEAALNQNKDYRVIIISQSQVQENLGTQLQNKKTQTL
ncbi:MAG: hypothetical protein EZS28_049783 [Streblomastix strix]|uniref:Uncharacterized protein n=1 Tax=Streblomastix strix TaxID=222440 RepID=A0A5J4TAX4_9EUKA|nr:MAG: hypothetical protein EZS28_049783 [Streblomastix strix]